ncbi:MAG: BTAD domain-containing putative transcriptional regulator [Micropruina sp.]|uniref:BTAD domain-containing putative transcriptional regulator n=1 Tax=Micropruina sp. TaxID=2737536 RepID=UPI0039E2FB4E
MTDSRTGPALRLGLLGPLSVEIDGHPVEVPGTLRRSLLAVLALASPRVVSVATLIDSLWAEEPRDSGQQALLTQVSRLRRTLGVRADRLERQAPGYRLVLDAPEFDLAEARGLAAQVSTELARRPARAAELAERALALWRGPALEEFAGVERLAGHALAVAELRRTLEHQWLTARIELGDRSVAPDAAALAAAEPLNEPAATLLVRALAAGGSTAEAMLAAAEFRRRLVDETGLDPSRRFAELEQQVASGTHLASSEPRPFRPTIVRPPGRLEGRERDRADLERLLGSESMVTVTGPGGVGKTRLVLDVVGELSVLGRCEAAVVRLAAVTDPRRLPEAIATALGLRTEGPPNIGSVAEGLAAQELLLVLDNAEHVVAGCRELITEVQRRAPQVRLLATSRVSLHAVGEYVLRLQPLAVPQPGVPLERLRRQPSARVFIDFATRRNARFSLTDGDVDDLIEVIRRLDGLPLGLELAAGQLATMPLSAVRQRLDRALDLLAEDRPDDDARQRTLRAAVDWSFRLLAEPERELLRVIAAFPGGIDLRAIEELAARLDGDPLLILGRLVDASLVVHDEHGRYTMLETVRRFVIDRTSGRGRGEDFERVFLEWTDRTLIELGRDLRGPGEPAADARLRAELDNLRVARDLARARGDLDLLIRITLTVDEPSTWRSLSELWAWAVELAGDPGLVGHPAESRVIGAAAHALWLQGDLDASRRMALRGLDLADGDPAASARCFSALATVDLFRGDFAGSLAGLLRSGDRALPVENLIVAALAAVYAGDVDRADALLEQANALLAEHPVVSFCAFADYVRGEAASAQGASDAAVASYSAAIDGARRAGVTFVEGIAGVGLAAELARRGEVAEAAAAFRRLLRYWTTTGNTTQLWTTMRNIAWLLADRDRLGDAAVLLRAADAAPSAAAVDSGTAIRGRRIVQAGISGVPLEAAAAVRLADRVLAELN